MNEIYHPLKENQPQPQFFCIFLPGALGDESNLRKLTDFLKSKYGEDNFFYLPSLFSRSVQGNDASLMPPERFRITANVLGKALEERKTVHIIAHSAGATELSQVIGEFKKINPRLLETSAERISIFLVSPAGFFKNIAGSLIFLRNLFRLGLTLTPFPSIYKGIESIIFFPPLFLNKRDEETINQFFTKLRSYLKKYSLYQEFMNLPQQKNLLLPPPTPYSNYHEQLSEKEKKELMEVDKNIQQLTSNFESPNRQQIRKMVSLIKKRGQILDRLIQKVYSVNEIDQEQKESVLKFLAQSFLGFSRLRILLAMFAGKAYQELKELIQKGSVIYGIIPEYDLIVPPKAFREMSRGSVLLVGYGHSSIGPLPPFKEVLDILSIS